MIASMQALYKVIKWVSLERAQHGTDDQSTCAGQVKYTGTKSH